MKKKPKNLKLKRIKKANQLLRVTEKEKNKENVGIPLSNA